MGDIAIQFDNVGKLYQLGTVGTGTLSHDLNRWWQMRVLGKEDPFLRIGQTNDRTQKGDSPVVWALKDISFNVKQGDVVGIIGKNGAGKSTLLKLLSRVTTPTVGTIRAKGRIASLLEVGTGFHPEMTGRENIYMNGSIMGMTKAEISSKLDEIVDFAGVARYLDTPVKRYSSGMMVRLGFAVAAFLEPEILVVDEVLAVGDAEFQKKAIGKMQDVASGQGRTVLFVSHNMAAVRSLCTSGIVLANGQIDYTGNVTDAVARYISANTQTDNDKITDAIKYKKDFVDITNIEINGTSDAESTITSDQKTLRISIEGETLQPIECEIKLIFRTTADQPVASSVDGRCTGKLMHVNPGKFKIHKEIELPAHMAKGSYILDLYLHQPTIQDFFQAPHCASIECDGKYDEYAHPILLRDEGFLSLVSVDTEIIQ